MNAREVSSTVPPGAVICSCHCDFFTSDCETASLEFPRECLWVGLRTGLGLVASSGFF